MPAAGICLDLGPGGFVFPCSGFRLRVLGALEFRSSGLGGLGLGFRAWVWASLRDYRDYVVISCQGFQGTAMKELQVALLAIMESQGMLEEDGEGRACKD